MKHPKRYASADLDKVEPAIATKLKELGAQRKSIYLFGDVGVGKTYASYAFANYVGEGNVELVNVPDLLRNIRSDFNKPEFEKVYEEKRIEEFDRYVIFDDIGAEKPSDWTIETLYCLINRRYEEELPTVFTSNCSLGQLAVMTGDRIASRIAEMCEVIELKGEDKRLI